MRDLENPLAPLSYPAYALAVDGQPSGLVIDSTAPVVWRGDGLAFCCRASAGPERAPGIGAHWLWSADNGWRSLPHPWVRADDEPMLQVGEPQALNDTAVVFEAHQDYPVPSEGRHGSRLSHVYGKIHTVVGHSPEGRPLIGTVSGTASQLVLPLSSRGGRGAATVESAPLENGERARLRWVGEQDTRGRYECRLGDWPLPGQWLLDHRVSDCGRYLALLPAPDNALPAGAVVVADVRQRTLLHSSPRLVARLLDFRGGVLSLAEISGRQNDDAPGSALCRVRQPAPPPEQAAAFLDAPSGTALLYECRRFEMHDDGLALLPDWRLIDRPPVAVADGDFIYPAPGNRDAAWLFGAATEYGGHDPHPTQPRRNGYLLTASGCALGGLTPAMIWSADGRWLALTRILEQRDEAGRQPWQLLILDPLEKRLGIRETPLGYLPDFDSFDERGLCFRVHQYDWEVEDDAGQPQRIPMQDVLSLPWAPLTGHDGWAFGPEQHDNRAYWEAWDRNPLQPWMQSSEEIPGEG